MSVLGFAIGAIALIGHRGGWIAPFPFIVMLGIGMYLPYMAVHTTLFERLLAVTRDKGNIGYLMYLVDSFGYLGYVAVMLREGYVSHGSVMPLFITCAWLATAGGMGVFVLAAIYFALHPAVKSAAGLPVTTDTYVKT
jgi:hypothetical protein